MVCAGVDWIGRIGGACGRSNKLRIALRVGFSLTCCAIFPFEVGTVCSALLCVRDCIVQELQHLCGHNRTTQHFEL
jgi:hypothetical protein